MHGQQIKINNAIWIPCHLGDRKDLNEAVLIMAAHYMYQVVAATLVKRYIYCLLIVAACFTGCGSKNDDRLSSFQPGESVNIDQTHPLLADALEKVVHNGQVDYASLRKGNESLAAFIRKAALVPRDQFNGWEKAERLAFLLNVYNASMLRLIAQHEPVDNVKDIGTWKTQVWDILAVDLFGRRHTLAELEHEMILKQFKSPQIHFALVCGAQSCPLLRPEPYTAMRLETQFSEQARDFLRDPKKNRVDIDNKTIYLSKIFEWFRDDFAKSDEELIQFVTPYYSEEVAEKIRVGGFKIRYTEYNWTLNNVRFNK